MQDSIESEIFIEAPIERVWELLTTAEHLGSWFGDAGAEIDLRPGGELELRWKNQFKVKGTVERVEPTTAFAYRWHHAEGATLVEFRLASEDNGTRVNVVESGFASLTPTEAAETKYESHTEGWERELGELKELATSVTI